MHISAQPVAAEPLWTAAPAPFRAVVAIPARNEAARLPDCLAAIAAQTGGAHSLAVLVLANGCRDGTAAAARAMAPALPFALHVVEARLPRELAHAGGARRAALDAALGLLGPDGVLLSTDADARPDPGWLTACLRAIAGGADAVAGQYRADPREARRLPAALRAREAAEAAYAALLDEMAALLDPVPHDPWPRHDVHSGASFALTAAAYRRVGGLPPLPVGEDRALFAALSRIDARIRHAPEAMVTVSARLRGRARGGMADTLRERRRDPAGAPADARLVPLVDAWTRACARHALRRAWQGQAADPAALGIGPGMLHPLLALPHLGMAWERLQQLSPLLARARPLDPATLPAETRRAAALVAALRRGAADPADSGDAVPAAAAA